MQVATEVKQVKTKLHSDGVLVIWKWDWDANAEKQEELNFVCNNIKSDSNSKGEEIHSEKEELEDLDPTACTPNITHAVTFKCSGAVRDKITQQTLRTVQNRMEKGYIWYQLN